MAPTFLTGFVSVGLKNLTKYVPHFPRPCGLKQILTWVLGLDSSSKGPKQIFTSVPLSLWTRTNFDLGSLSVFGFVSPSFTAPYIEFVSLRLESLTKYVPHFPPPCGSKQMLTWVHFPSACFLKFYWRSFRSASGHHHTYRICFAWPARPNWLSSLSLVDPNKFWPGFTFPQAWFLKFYWCSFRSASAH